MLLLLQSSAAPAGSTVTTSQAQTGSMSGAVSMTATGATQQAQTAGATGNQTVVAVISGQQGQSASGSGSVGITGVMATAQSQGVTGNAAVIGASSGSTAQAQGSAGLATVSGAEVVEVVGLTGYPGKQKKQKQYYEQPILTLLSDRVAAVDVVHAIVPVSTVEIIERAGKTEDKTEAIAALVRDLSQIQNHTQAVQHESLALEAEIIKHQEQQTLAAFEALMWRMDERDIELLLLA